MNFKRAKLQNRLLKILETKSITGEILQAQNSPQNYIYDADLAKTLGFNLQKLHYFLKGLEDDKFVNSVPYSEGGLKFLAINENGKYFIEHGGYICKYKKEVLKKSGILFTSIIAILLSIINTYITFKESKKSEISQIKIEHLEKSVEQNKLSLDSFKINQSNKKVMPIQFHK